MADASQCARVVIAELIARGVRELVLAPGSRSAPLAYEVFEADRIGLLRLHVRIDERTRRVPRARAGQGVGEPVAVVTTSGTAAANLHPAVLEASHGQLPLIMVTADRPAYLINTGANQTTDQLSCSAATSGPRRSSMITSATYGSWRFETARLVTAATGGAPPTRDRCSSTSSSATADADAGRRSTTRPPVTIEPLRRPAEPVVAAGRTADGDRRRRRRPELGPRRPSWPSGRAAAAGRAVEQRPPRPDALGLYRLLLRSTLAEEIERVIVFGHPTLSRPVSRLLARDDVELIVVTAYADWDRPRDLARTLVAAAVALPPGDPDWLDRWRQADAGCGRRLDQLLAGLRLQRAAAGRRRLGRARRLRHPVRRLVQPGPRPRPGADHRRPADGLRQPRPGRHRRHHLHRGRDRAGHRPPDPRAARRPDLPARPDGLVIGPDRAAARPAGGGGQRRRRQHLRHPGARAAGPPARVRADLRHAARSRPGAARRRRRRSATAGSTDAEARRGPGRAADRASRWSRP